MSKALRLLAFALLVGVICEGCSIANRRAGIPNRWQVRNLLEKIQPGETTEQQVLDVFGPPSHVMEIHERTVFYYLLEHDHTVGLFLGVFNWTDTEARYDRAIFIFDATRKLEEFAVSDPKDLEEVP